MERSAIRGSGGGLVVRQSRQPESSREAAGVPDCGRGAPSIRATAQPLYPCTSGPGCLMYFVVIASAAKYASAPTTPVGL
jgi:hypothetical protein